MQCPHCHQELSGKKCSRCEALVPEESRYCLYCGNALGGEIQEGTAGEEDFDLEHRIPCPDGSCTGILVDGKCTECGMSPEESASATG